MNEKAVHTVGFFLFLFVTLPLGIGVALIPHRMLGSAALASSTLNLPLGVALFLDQWHRPEAAGAIVPFRLVTATPLRVEALSERSGVRLR